MFINYPMIILSTRDVVVNLYLCECVYFNIVFLFHMLSIIKLKSLKFHRLGRLHKGAMAEEGSRADERLPVRRFCVGKMIGAIITIRIPLNKQRWIYKKISLFSPTSNKFRIGNKTFLVRGVRQV